MGNWKQWKLKNETVRSQNINQAFYHNLVILKDGFTEVVIVKRYPLTFPIYDLLISVFPF